MAKETLIIIDYGSGNLHSAAKSFEHVVANEAREVEVKISDKPEDVLAADRQHHVQYCGACKTPSGIDRLRKRCSVIDVIRFPVERSVSVQSP